MPGALKAPEVCLFHKEVCVSESHHLERREFVKVVLTFLGTFMGALIGLPAIGYLISPAAKTEESEAWVPLGPMENYQIGKPTLFNFTRSQVNGWEKTVNSYGVYVLRHSADQATVFSNMCTHLSCRVTYHEDLQEHVCPCHDGRFDSQGNVVSGPPPRPLDTFETKVEEGSLFIHFLEG